MRTLNNPAFEVCIQFTKLGFRCPQGLFVNVPLGNVGAFDEDRRDIARMVSDGLKNEVHIASFASSTRCLLPNEFCILADVGFAGGEHAVEQIKETLALNFGKGLANGQAYHIPMPDKPLVRLIGQDDPVFWAVK